METINKCIGVFIVDDHPVVREGIVKLINSEDDMYIVGEAGDVNEAINRMNDDRIDIAIIDIQIKGEMSGLKLIKSVKERYPKVKTLVLSMFEETMYAERAIRNGALGFLQKSEAPDNIILSIRKVINGQLCLSESLNEKMLYKMVYGCINSEKSSINILTDRELEVFRLIGNGNCIKDISMKLNLSNSTVETHRRNIKNKLFIKSNTDLVRYAVQWVMMKE